MLNLQYEAQAIGIDASLLINGVVSIPIFTTEEREQFPKASDWQDRFMLDQVQVKGVRYVG